MKRASLFALIALTAVLFALTGCSDDGEEGLEEQLQENEAKLNKQQQLINEMRSLQAIENRSDEQEARLQEIYAQLESQANSSTP